FLAYYPSPSNIIQIFLVACLHALTHTLLSTCRGCMLLFVDFFSMSLFFVFDAGPVILKEMTYF
ncbi:hypothetical protein ACJX0J_019964, partial [Zea mays]